MALKIWSALLIVEILVLILYWFKIIKPIRNEAVLLFIQKVLQLGFGAMFIASSYPKLVSTYEFALLVAQYQLLPSGLVNLFSLWLPAMELILGILLILSPWIREMGILVLMLLVMFIIALSQALVRDLGITCGCFDISGAQDKMSAWISLIRDFVLFFPALWLACKAKNKFIWNIQS